MTAYSPPVAPNRGLDKVRGFVLQYRHKVVSSIVLPHCWVCGLQSTALEQHHVVPRCYGGTNGPTVTLCGSCHSLAHNTARRLYFLDVCLEQHDPHNVQDGRMLYLSCVLALSAAFEPINSRVRYSGSWSQEEHRMLKRIQMEKCFSTQHETLAWCVLVVTTIGRLR